MHPYVQAVVDNPDLLAYWGLGAGGEAGVGPDPVVLTGATPGAAGPLLHGDLGATSFDGADDFAQVPVALGGKELITVEFFALWDANGTNDDFLLEYSATANSQVGFNLDYNAADGASVKVNWGLGAGRWTTPRPSEDVWHHWMLAIAASGLTAPVICIDGEEVAVGVGDAPSSNEGVFEDKVLNLFSRNGAALFGAGDLAHLAIYDGDVTDLAEAHFEAASAEEEVEEPESGPEFDDARIGWAPDTEGSPLQRNHANGV